MNATIPELVNPTSVVLRKAQLTGLLERVCQELELTDTQFATAKTRYEAVGGWIAEAEHRLLKSATIYSQGSISIGTTVKPLGREEHDIDLVCLTPDFSPALPPAVLKKVIGDRLRENGRYKNILEEKPRCWRINYANEFHLDITPSIPDPACAKGGELVPDKLHKDWKQSNPKGYRKWFEDLAKLQPALRLFEREFAKARASIEALPEPTRFKGLLRRSIQLCKRHRDIWFAKKNADLAPISIIITTLAAKSYAYCASTYVYDTELDVLIDVVRTMPRFIKTVHGVDRCFYFVWNETTTNENFSEKWNVEPRLAKGFYDWQNAAVNDLEHLVSLSGLDQIAKSLAVPFGDTVVSKAIGGMTAAVSNARASHILSVAPGVGLAIGASRGTTVRPNTFYGV